MNELIEKVDIKRDYTVGEIVTVLFLIFAVGYFTIQSWDGIVTLVSVKYGI